MLEEFKRQFASKMKTITLNRESSRMLYFALIIDDLAERAVMLQNSVMMLESEIQNLSSELENYRQCVRANNFPQYRHNRSSTTVLGRSISPPASTIRRNSTEDDEDLYALDAAILRIEWDFKQACRRM